MHDAPDPLADLISLADAVAIMPRKRRVTTVTLARHAAAGRFPARKIGDTWVTTRTAALAWVAPLPGRPPKTS